MPTWEFEPGHTSATFAVRHMMITIVRGHFKNLKGKFHFDPADPARGSIEVTIDAASFSTAEPERDAHLRSADFLDVANYPTITFKSTSVEPTGTNHSKVTGDLTIRGVTRPVILEVEYFGPVDTPFNNRRMGYLARTRINREDFGCSWNSPMPGGGWVVGKEVEITIDVEGILVA
ncbi:MAG: polyisoprenoid-binding protein [Acidobacteria bacterium]|nr:MAG: polyisoprenoid-binding protein [Acidobacteriota bacterium]